ncbi:NOT2 family protein [Mycena indigotica]|uniref:NOT2 family protein n=1 Tax=Mycena indigotica TaxID=2126181 RepID=A0A8H6W4Z2_9AGAR|nr:NOT2 family protein [Mycena indigotica]KAF7299409.1 NOT2 family protein [Mycena indigotica]
MNRPAQRPPTAQQATYRPSPQQQTAPPNSGSNTAAYAPYGIPPRTVIPGTGYIPQRVPLGTPFLPRATNGTTNPNGTTPGSFPFGLGGLPPHLQQQQQHSLTATTTNDAALDPNDFPALGAAQSSPANPPSSTTQQQQSTSSSSYASAGSVPQPASGTHSHPPRDLTQDDFPALGGSGESSSTSTTTTAPSTNNGAPPGLFPGNNANAIPGMLNISGMGMMAGRPFEDKRHPNPSSTPYTASKPAPQQNSQPAPAPSTPAWPSSASTSNANPNGTTYTENGHGHPQTPAQQVLVSAADRWGLLALLAMIREASDPDHLDGRGRLGSVRLGGVGTDLSTMGLDMGYAGTLYSTFVTPWADQNAALGVEPDFNLPACYANVHAPPPGPAKASAFSDETLFFMFYASARDALQEVAAQELWNRNWRYHKDLRLWITKESGTAPSTKIHGGEAGLYTIWDPEAWAKEHKEMNVLYVDLEEKNVPAFVQGPGLVPVTNGTPQQQQSTQSQPPSQSQSQAQRGFAMQ